MGRAIVNGDIPGPVPQNLPIMMDTVTKEFLKANPDLSDADPMEILAVYTCDMRNAFILWNDAWGTLKKTKEGHVIKPEVILSTGGNGGIMYPKELPGYVIGDLLARRHTWANVNLANISGAMPSECELGVYIKDGPRAGIYDISDDAKLRIFRELCPQLCSAKDKMFAEIESRIKQQAPVLRRTGDAEEERQYIPVANGVWDMANKELLPFSSEFVYVSKAEIAYNANATNPVITEQGREPWDFESWLLDLVSDVAEDKDALMQSMNFALRPASVSSRTMYWISDNFGASGKGTLAQVIEDLLGGRAIKHANLDDIGGEYTLYDLAYKSLILGLDNERGYMLGKSNTLKLLATKEAIQANRKYRDPVTFRFLGQNLQLMNGFPVLKDKSDSNMRRPWLFGFYKTFANADRKYIKADYLRRKDVLEYVMKRLLELPYLEELPETANTAACMDRLREVNSTVYDFCAEMLSAEHFPSSWNAYDGLALYKIFTMWSSDQGKDENRTIKSARFYDELEQALRNNPELGFTYDKTLCLNKDSAEMQPLIEWDEKKLIWYGVETYTHKDFISHNGYADVKVHNMRVRPDVGTIKGCRGCIVRTKPAA